MMTLSGGLSMLRSVIDRLPKSERKIASFILDYPEAFISMTAQELGRESGTSSAAVIRLCKSLKIKGFQELKLRVAGDLHQKQGTDFRDIEADEPTADVIEKVSSNIIQTLSETKSLVNKDDLDQAVQVLTEANRIHLFGVGASSIPAFDMEQKFLRINKNVSSFSDVHMGATVVANFSEKDVVFCISFSGETKEVIEIMKIAKKSGAKTISLTKYGSNSVNALADIALFTSSNIEAERRSAATSTRMSQLLVMDILFMKYVSSNYDTVAEYLDLTRSAVDDIR